MAGARVMRWVPEASTAPCACTPGESTNHMRDKWRKWRPQGNEEADRLFMDPAAMRPSPMSCGYMFAPWLLPLGHADPIEDIPDARMAAGSESNRPRGLIRCPTPSFCPYPGHPQGPAHRVWHEGCHEPLPPVRPAHGGTASPLWRFMTRSPLPPAQRRHGMPEHPERLPQGDRAAAGPGQGLDQDRPGPR